MLKINGVAIATPKIFQVDIEDIDGESNRNTRGELLRDRIAIKRKLNLEWAPLKMNEISVLLKAVKDVYFEVNYPDPMEGTMLTKTFYVGGRSAPAHYYDGVKNEMLWQGLKMNFIEK
ncbi:MAG: DUF6711 family protein [Clostridium sp.]